MSESVWFQGGRSGAELLGGASLPRTGDSLASELSSHVSVSQHGGHRSRPDCRERGPAPQCEDTKLPAPPFLASSFPPTSALPLPPHVFLVNRQKRER